MLASQNNSLLKWLNVYMLLMSMCPKLEATSTIKDNDIHVWQEICIVPSPLSAGLNVGWWGSFLTISISLRRRALHKRGNNNF